MKKKTYVIIFISCLFAVGIGVYVYFQEYLILKNEALTLEYGETTSLEKEDLLNLKDINEERKEDILTHTIIDTDFKNEENKDYPAVGEYTVLLSYFREEKTMKIKVEDTTQPTIIKPQHIQILEGEDLDEKTLLPYFQAKDLAQTKITFDFLQYDQKKSGLQTIQVIATDQNGNETREDYTIETIKKPDLNRYKVETEVEKDKAGNISNVKIKITEKKVVLDVTIYSHHTVGASRGCDPAALYQALRYKGYCKNIGLRAFIDDMPRSASNPYKGFAGNPNGPDDPNVLESIFPSAMVPWAKKYGQVFDFSGHSVDDIIGEIRKGNPVMVYTTYGFKAPKWKDWSFGRMYSNLHCLTISGFDMETQRIRYTDAGGKRESAWISLATFKQSYDYKKFAIVVR